MNKKITGIYKIENTINGKFYIGCSGDIAKRWKEHIKGRGNKYLYNAIKKYGEDSFIFIVLEECKIEEIYIKEKQWMEKLNPVYNLIQSIAGVYKHSEETIEKLSGENNPNYGKGLFKEKNGMYGKKHSLETRKKISETHKGKFAGKNNPRWKGGVSLDVKSYQRAWYLKNAEKLKTKHKEYMKAYRLRKKMEQLNNE